MEKRKTEFVCVNWQYFIQRIMALVNRGYYYYSISTIPKNKVDVADSIDHKIRSKYLVTSNKDKYFRNKRKGRANYEYLRCEDVFIIMKTAGESHENEDDKFENIDIKPIVIQVGNIISLFIRKHKKLGDKKNHYTVAMTDQTIFRLKSKFIDIIKRRKVDDLKSEFNKLNSLPCWAGINKQKQKLKSEILFQCHRCHVDIDETKFKIMTSRKIYTNVKSYNNPNR